MPTTELSVPHTRCSPKELRLSASLCTGPVVAAAESLRRHPTAWRPEPHHRLPAGPGSSPHKLKLARTTHRLEVRTSKTLSPGKPASKGKGLSSLSLDNSPIPCVSKRDDPPRAAPGRRSPDPFLSFAPLFVHSPPILLTPKTTGGILYVLLKEKEKPVHAVPVSSATYPAPPRPI